MKTKNVALWVVQGLLAALFLFAGFVSYSIMSASGEDKPTPRTTSDWPSYGNDPGGMRYARLTTINPGNVSKLKQAWEYRTGDKSNGKRKDSPSTSAFEATPILVGGRLVFCTPFNRVIALDPLIGKELWVFDPHIDLKVFYENQLACRGVSQWMDQAPRPGQRCVTRIFTGTNDGRLIALDATDGQKCQDFGKTGEIDLRDPADIGRRADPNRVGPSCSCAPTCALRGKHRTAPPCRPTPGESGPHHRTPSIPHRRRGC